MMKKIVHFPPETRQEQLQIEGIIDLGEKPYMNQKFQRKNIIKMTIVQPKENQKFQDQSRIHQILILYILVIIATVISSGQSIIQYNTPKNWASRLTKFAVLGSLELFQILVFAVSLFMLVSWRQALRLCLLLDNILAAQLATVYVLITLQIITNTEQTDWNDIISFILTPISLHLQSMNFRALCIYVNWSKPKVIIYKLSLLAMTIFYLGYGCYFFIVGYKFTQGDNSDLDDKVFQFMVLYTCTNFAYCLQLFSKLGDIDGTNEMKSQYYLQKIGNNWVLSKKEIEDQKNNQRNQKNSCQVKDSRTIKQENNTADNFFKINE